MSHRPLILCASAALLAGCSGATPRGDATLVETSKRFIIVGIPRPYWLSLPAVSLGQSATHTFAVRGLPPVELDYYLQLRGRYSSQPGQDGSLRSCLVEVICNDLAGKSFFSRRFRFGDLRWDLSDGEATLRLSSFLDESVGAKRLATARDFDLRVTIITPSGKRTDTVSVRAAGGPSRASNRALRFLPE